MSEPHSMFELVKNLHARHNYIKIASIDINNSFFENFVEVYFTTEDSDVNIDFLEIYYEQLLSYPANKSPPGKNIRILGRY
jgi:hypothetical protein